MRQQQAAANRRTVGPFIAVIGDVMNEGKSQSHENGDLVGEDKEELEILIILTTIEYKIKRNSLIEAVDFCFKILSTLNLDLPAECKHIWTFFQLYIFKIDEEKAHTYKCVSILIQKLNELLKSNIEVEIPEKENLEISIREKESPESDIEHME